MAKWNYQGKRGRKLQIITLIILKFILKKTLSAQSKYEFTEFKHIDNI